MKKRSDMELVQILTIDKDDYLPAALVAAEEEFKNRNRQTDSVNAMRERLSKEKQAEIIRSNEPLFFGVKALTFLFPFVLTFVFSGLYKAEGYDRKARELAAWTFYGFFFYLVLIILIVVL